MIARLFRNNNPQPALSRGAHLSYCRQCTGRFQTCPYRLLLLLLLFPALAFAQTPNLTVCAGKGYTLTSNVEATGASEVTYEWYESVDGATAVPIDNSNTASYSFAAGKATAGTYAYVRKAANAECPGGVFSNTYTVVVAGAPVVASVSASTLCAGGTATLTATVSGGTTTSMTYTWTIGGTPSITDVKTKATQPLNANTTFTVSVTNSIGCTSAQQNGTITVTMPAASGKTVNACGCRSGLCSSPGGTCRVLNEIPECSCWSNSYNPVNCSNITCPSLVFRGQGPGDIEWCQGHACSVGASCYCYITITGGRAQCYTK